MGSNLNSGWWSFTNDVKQNLTIFDNLFLRFTNIDPFPTLTVMSFMNDPLYPVSNY